jgi:hypothetical protein
MKTKRMRKIRFDVEADLRLERPGIGTIAISTNEARNIDIDFSSFRMLIQPLRNKLLYRAISIAESSVTVRLRGRRMVKIPASFTGRFI